MNIFFYILGGKEMTLDEFIKELKPLVVYDKIKRLHYMGKDSVLTNKEIDGMLELLLEDEYTLLNGTQREKMRERVFKKLRGTL